MGDDYIDGLGEGIGGLVRRTDQGPLYQSGYDLGERRRAEVIAQEGDNGKGRLDSRGRNILGALTNAGIESRFIDAPIIVGSE